AYTTSGRNCTAKITIAVASSGPGAPYTRASSTDSVRLSGSATKLTTATTRKPAGSTSVIASGLASACTTTIAAADTGSSTPRCMPEPPTSRPTGFAIATSTAQISTAPA